jgi:hypothetical protein
VVQEVTVLLLTGPRAGYIGSVVSRFRKSLQLRNMVEQDLSNFKKYMKAKAIEFSHENDYA